VFAVEIPVRFAEEDLAKEERAVLAMQEGRA
jgi:hypothetical protein